MSQTAQMLALLLLATNAPGTVGREPVPEDGPRDEKLDQLIGRWTSQATEQLNGKPVPIALTKVCSRDFGKSVLCRTQVKVGDAEETGGIELFGYDGPSQLYYQFQVHGGTAGFYSGNWRDERTLTLRKTVANAEYEVALGFVSPTRLDFKSIRRTDGVETVVSEALFSRAESDSIWCEERSGMAGHAGYMRPGESYWEGVGTTITSHGNEIRECYDKSLATQPRLSGKITARWMIDFEGAPSRPCFLLTDTTLRDSDLLKCIQTAITRWKFEKPRRGMPVRVNYPWVLVPAPEEIRFDATSLRGGGDPRKASVGNSGDSGLQSEPPRQ